MNGFIREMQLDYEGQSSGILSRDQARYYTDMSAVLYARGGYSNWHLAKVLDFRVAYSIAKQVYASGTIDNQGKSLVSGLAGRAMTSGSITTLVREELDPKLADQLSRLLPEAALQKGFDSLAGTGDWPPMLKGDILKRKDLPELVWRFLLHAFFVKMSVPAMSNAAPKIGNWSVLSLDQKATSILANVDALDYRFGGRDRLEKRDVTALLALIVDASSPFNDLRKQ